MFLIFGERNLILIFEWSMGRSVKKVQKHATTIPTEANKKRKMRRDGIIMHLPRAKQMICMQNYIRITSDVLVALGRCILRLFRSIVRIMLASAYMVLVCVCTLFMHRLE